MLDDPYDPLIGAQVEKTDPALPPLERVRRGILEAWASVEEPDDAITRERLRILSRREDLLAQVWSNNRRTEQIIVDALTATEVPRLAAWVAAGAVVGAMVAALSDWGQHENAGSLGARTRQALQVLGSDGGADD